MRNFLSILDLDPDRLATVLELAAKLKRARVKGMKAPTAAALNGKHVGLLFEKPSLRTRVTFTIGVRELGGDIVEIPADVMHADREQVQDVARNLERWVDAVVIRTFAQERLSRIAECSWNYVSASGVGAVAPPSPAGTRARAATPGARGAD